MSNSLDPDQDRQYVGPDLGPNCLKRLSADDKGQRSVLHTVQINFHPMDVNKYRYIQTAIELLIYFLRL